MRQRYSADDADAGAGTPLLVPRAGIETAPSSTNTINSANTDLDFFEDKITEPVLVLGVDITHWNDQQQFLYCASGVFGFSLCYGYLQELLSVTLCSRKLGLFLAMMQFLGYTILAYCMRIWVYYKHNQTVKMQQSQKVPLNMYLGLSLLRAIDLAMTNLAMQYINYPAKTLMKSSRVVFTMLFGVLIQGKLYKLRDYGIVFLMVIGLGSFLHADAKSSAVFEIRGVLMLTVSLLCDGMISNVSETILRQYGVGQDEFIFRLYSISLLCIIAAAIANGDFYKGFLWSFHSGTYDEYLKMTDASHHEEVTPSYSAGMKIIILIMFSSMGFFGSSCSAAITKNFGALTMSITSTARKATTLFLSFCLFRENVCTIEHVFGMVIFIAALAAKSMKRNKTNLKKKFSNVMIPMASSAATMDKSSPTAVVHVV